MCMCVESDHVGVEDVEFLNLQHSVDKRNDQASQVSVRPCTGIGAATSHTTRPRPSVISWRPLTAFMCVCVCAARSEGPHGTGAVFVAEAGEEHPVIRGAPLRVHQAPPAFFTDRAYGHAHTVFTHIQHRHTIAYTCLSAWEMKTP